MSSFQVLFSGEVVSGASVDAVQANLARELGIDERKARQLFSGRTVVLKSQLEQHEAGRMQTRLSELGAVCRVKDLAPKESRPHFDIDSRESDYTLKDITAAHVECPRCAHLQLETQYCARCGVDIAQATRQKRKEDKIIEKKIRELKARPAPRPEPRDDTIVDFDPDEPLITRPEDAPIRAGRFTLSRLFKKP